MLLYTISAAKARKANAFMAYQEDDTTEGRSSENVPGAPIPCMTIMQNRIFSRLFRISFFLFILSLTAVSASLFTFRAARLQSCVPTPA